MSQFVIAVHCGAGYHSTSDEARLCNAMGPRIERRQCNGAHALGDRRIDLCRVRTPQQN
jgi:hypothetical protein